MKRGIKVIGSILHVRVFTDVPEINTTVERRVRISKYYFKYIATLYHSDSSYVLVAMHLIPMRITGGYVTSWKWLVKHLPHPVNSLVSDTGTVRYYPFYCTNTIQY